ncbi:MAG: capsid protein [Eubacteriales bacterium]|nr:capsid protein [Eubacteriales bacterium]
MAEKIRQGIRSFLQIEPAQGNVVHIQEVMDYETNAIKNRIWYRGESEELSALYKSVNVDSTMFWKAVPTVGREIRKIHTGLPGIIVDILTSIVIADMNDISVSEKQNEWDAIVEDNNFSELAADAITETLIIGDGAFKFTINTDISQYPMIEFVSGENIEYKRQHGRVIEIVFKTLYKANFKTYELEERYGKNYIITKLYDHNREVPLNTIEELSELPAEVTYNGDFIMAVPFMIFKSSKWKGRGKSVFDTKCDNFDSLDEAWSQWMDALRRGRSKEYVPDTLIPRNPATGEPLKPNAFDNQYIQCEGGMGEGENNKVELIQPNIPHESYLATYITALDLCLQGLISPSTLGIDTKKLDNADAQREKEKATLYTRNKIVEAVQNTFPDVVNVAIKTYEVLMNQPVTKQTVDIPFGEYANPSFESQVETVTKAKQGGVMSIEASVEELYGDSKDKSWKTEEIKRLKEEQGIVGMEEPAVNTEGLNVSEV